MHTIPTQILTQADIDEAVDLSHQYIDQEAWGINYNMRERYKQYMYQGCSVLKDFLEQQLKDKDYKPKLV